MESRDKCYKCHRPKTTCLCKYISPIQTDTQFVILMHPMERQKVKNNTGRLTHLSLPNSILIDGVDFTHNEKVNEIIRNTNSYLLYPGEESITSKDLPKRAKKSKVNSIFIIDSTWPCSKKILRLSQNIRNLPGISIDVSSESKYVFKKQPKENYLSTIESTQQLLKELKEAQKESYSRKELDNFLEPFIEMVKMQVYFENNPQLNGYRRKNKLL